MGVEIERKFLVAGDGWRAAAGPGVRMRQGYLAAGGGALPVVRVRIAGDRAWITVKGPGGKVRAEFEYAVPLRDAEAMLALCPWPVLAKTRFEVPDGHHLWTVDVFEAPARLAGLVCWKPKALRARRCGSTRRTKATERAYSVRAKLR
ncbi:CYTH domain-containing protein [Leptolyngbya sp. 15MV]|nr:CYTH domain-containing protein [Leptolyngbya sp. 15MV]